MLQDIICEPMFLLLLDYDFDFTFVGLLALEDPVRPAVPAAVAQCRAAGMRVVMITGEHPVTAVWIARQAGISTDSAPLTGRELEGMDDAALRLRLVRALRTRGDIAAMTGDGINDAPGTGVVREAAARQGRRLFARLRKAIVSIVAACVPITGLSILPALLVPAHILFLQLIIDPACSIVFGVEPAESDAMRLAPRKPGQQLFDRDLLLRGLLQGAGLLAMLLGMFWYARASGPSDEAARAAIFIALTFSGSRARPCRC
ncbi:HAD-IC family P-type ATPase [Janthinobacterium sp. GB1R12]|uniref:HAD-IC family P-type ATPase n=1 Tax=Janthinobacterium sp. GB1R12 TaxID=3424190 RepID=UPI003F23EAD4